MRQYIKPSILIIIEDNDILVSSKHLHDDHYKPWYPWWYDHNHEKQDWYNELLNDDSLFDDIFK